MRKFFVRLLCCFIPGRVARQRVRSALKRSKYDVILEKISQLSKDGDLLNSQMFQLSNDVKHAQEMTNNITERFESFIASKTVKTEENYVFNGKNNKLLVWDNEKQEYIETIKKIPGLNIQIKGNNNVIKFGNIPITDHLDIIMNSSENLLQIGNKVNSKWAHIDGLVIVMPYNKCECIIGDDMLVGRDVVISLGEPKSKIKIGKRVRIAEKVRILASDFHPIVDVKNGTCINYGYGKRCLTIGDCCWLGLNSFIGKSCVLPDYTIVASHGVATKKYTEPDTVLAGNPAMVVKRGVRRMCDDWADVIAKEDLS